MSAWKAGAWKTTAWKVGAWGALVAATGQFVLRLQSVLALAVPRTSRIARILSLTSKV